ncbi:cysteinyl-tRNA synthetase [Marchantia polymorpha subsp. ruderalis]|nr:hypothetical protein MARPO_0047s0029 [Marchantia polymorpha]PTQ39046.1 hypothetical protein MARPO_0047s0029 [Marchantia polymorpha]BBN14707.1 hypothetical protein Mp_6g13780 [Marchantia polymorpha subsp. ruderalis]BBN14708.1 hypothetical protein Mp_6g13780 [Marchantia polymorpha subsp. ruderalis]|eukprot:PTQ39045.1 hypothetical protein MARPO_0047s0029 [Marchantia polymorpha]
MEIRENGVGEPQQGTLKVHKCWSPPGAPSKPLDGLKVFNSLSGTKVPFQTIDGTRRVTWYNCGPTVYDSSHVGHARNYLTFDIIRRIMEDYFGYEIRYVMNVTDVDDKIINRARRNHLLNQYLSTVGSNLEEVLQDLSSHFPIEVAKQRKKVAEAEGELASSASGQQKKVLEEKVKQEQLKLAKLEEALKTMLEKVNEAKALGGKEGINVLLSPGATDVLTSHLDAKAGAEVTDHEIFRSHAAKFEKDFFEDMGNLGVRPPTYLTRVTGYVDKIIAYVESIIERGFAYAANGSVYFDTKAFIDAGHTYGKLNPWAIGSAGLASESEANFETTEKKSKSDFALWKASKSGEPFWDSPWGKGRPGWHIECSAMASDVIGQTMDIHSGGNDLQFPHHDNELAQAEAFYGCSQWVNYFFHSGHLAIDGLKMSKSLKNFITIKQALEMYTARQLRFLFVIQLWDKPMTFSKEVMDIAISREQKLKTFFQEVQIMLRQMNVDDNQRWGEDEKNLSNKLLDGEQQVRERLEDNFDTPGALNVLLDLVSEVYIYRDKQARGYLNLHLVKEIAQFVTKILSVFGLSDAGRGEIGWGSVTSGAGVQSGSIETLVAPYLDAIASFRDQVRAVAREMKQDKILSLADNFRDYTMVDLGVRLEDRVDGSTWKLDEPTVLRGERDEKLKKAAEEKRLKLERSRDRQVKEIDKLEAAAKDPRDLFKGRTSEFSAFDNDGMPTHDVKGVEITSSSRKKLKKDMDAAKKAHDNLKQKLSTDSNFIEGLRTELRDIEEKISMLKTS